MRVWVKCSASTRCWRGVCLLSIGNSFETQAYALELNRGLTRTTRRSCAPSGSAGSCSATLGSLVATPWVNTLVFRGGSRSQPRA